MAARLSAGSRSSNSRGVLVRRGFRRGRGSTDGKLGSSCSPLIMSFVFDGSGGLANWGSQRRGLRSLGQASRQLSHNRRCKSARGAQC